MASASKCCPSSSAATRGAIPSCPSSQSPTACSPWRSARSRPAPRLRCCSPTPRPGGADALRAASDTRRVRYLLRLIFAGSDIHGLPGAARSDALGVVRESLPVHDDARLVAGDPSVVAGRDVRVVAGAEVELLAVVHPHVHPARYAIAGVLCLAALRACDRLDVLRPAPAGLEGGQAHRAGFRVDQFQAAHAVLEEPGLVRLVEVLVLDARHPSSPSLRLAPAARRRRCTGRPLCQLKTCSPAVSLRHPGHSSGLARSAGCRCRRRASGHPVASHVPRPWSAAVSARASSSAAAAAIGASRNAPLLPPPWARYPASAWPPAVPSGPPAQRIVIAEAVRSGGAIRSVRVYKVIMYGATVILAIATAGTTACSRSPT